jgi:hypothetical protein
LIAEHPTEFAYDFRTRFGVSVFEIGQGITWLEATHLAAALLKDPTSWAQAAHNNWTHPVSFEWIALAHTYDLHTAVNSKRKPKPYPTPWADKDSRKLGSKNQSREHVLKMLKRTDPKE